MGHLYHGYVKQPDGILWVFTEIIWPAMFWSVGRKWGIEITLAIPGTRFGCQNFIMIREPDCSQCLIVPLYWNHPKITTLLSFKEHTIIYYIDFATCVALIFSCGFLAMIERCWSTEAVQLLRVSDALIGLRDTRSRWNPTDSGRVGPSLVSLMNLICRLVPE
jgi:hypothetical protein